LEELKVWSLIQKFPEELKPAFVFSGTLDPADVLEIIKPGSVGFMNEATERVFSYLQEFIQESTQTCRYMIFCWNLKLVDIIMNFLLRCICIAQV